MRAGLVCTSRALGSADTMFDIIEYTRWLEQADDDLLVAQHDVDGGFHHAAVLYAEQAVQCALKGLLHGVGEGKQARGHGLVGLAERCEEVAALVLDDARLDGLRSLARDSQPSRYPDAWPEGSPMRHYGATDAARSIEVAKAIVHAVEAAWDELQRAASEQPSDETGGAG